MTRNPCHRGPSGSPVIPITTEFSTWFITGTGEIRIEVLHGPRHQQDGLRRRGALAWARRPTPARATYDEIAEAARFYEAVERQVFIPPFNSPIPDKKALVRGDESVIRKYVLGCAGHDGYTAVVIKNVATRVVRANTLGEALGERGGASWRIQHTASAKERLEEAGKAFRRIAQSYETLGELANVMAMSRFTSKQMQTTIDGILPVPPDDRDHRRLLVEREKVQRLHGGASCPSRWRF